MGASCLRVVFCLVTVLSALIAFGLACGGVWYSLQLKQLTDLRNFESYQLDLSIRWPQMLPYLFAGVGTFGLLVICCGLCGTKSKGCLLTYTICAGVVLLAVLGVGALAMFLAKDTSEDFIKETLNSAFQEARTKPAIRAKFEEFEASAHCCGVVGPQNYHVLPEWQRKLPASCCDGGAGVDCNLLNPRRGCVLVAAAYTQWAYYIGTAACLAIGVCTLIGMVLAVVIVRRMSTKEIA